MVDDAALRALDGSAPAGATHWVVASQTCNLYSSDFDSIARVEWVGAVAISSPDPIRQGGRNPRQLDGLGTTASGAQLWLRCDCQLRHWGRREDLAQLAPCAALRDGQEPQDRQKDIFARWLARGYTRLELSDELGAALSNSKFGDAVNKLVKQHERQIFGFFLELDAFDESQNSPEKIAPPCGVDLTIVVREQADVEPVKAAAAKLFDDKSLPGPSGKRTRTQAMQTDFGLSFQFVIQPMERWSAVRLQETLRYNFQDHHSGSDEVAGD